MDDSKKIKKDMESMLKSLDSLVSNVQTSMEETFKKMGKKEHLKFVEAMKTADVSAALKDIEEAKKKIKNAKFT